MLQVNPPNDYLRAMRIKNPTPISMASFFKSGSRMLKKFATKYSSKKYTTTIPDTILMQKKIQKFLILASRLARRCESAMRSEVNESGTKSGNCSFPLSTRNIFAIKPSAVQ